MFQPLFAFSLALLSVSQPVPQKIAVKIFPHLRDLSPEGLDPVPSQVELKSASACKIYAGEADSAAPSGVLKSSVATLDITLNSAALSTPLWIECAGPIAVVRQDVKENYSYGGPIYAHAVTSGPELIEVKSLNDYLKGVVPSEMPASWPAQALQAQAVAARTYAVFHILLAQQDGVLLGDRPLYDVDDTVLYQAYTGEMDRTPASDQAVDATGSQVLTYQNQIIQAYFSADAGGYTEEADHVWPVTAPYCVSKPEPFEDAGLDNGRWGPWTVTFPLHELNQKLEAAGLIPVTNPVLNLWVNDGNRYISGRARVVTLEFLDGTVTNVDALEFQHALGLRSTMITPGLDPTGKQVVIDGRGFGHGVGMSQYGARLAAINGWSYQQILNFYYSGVALCTISADGSVSCPSGLLK